MLDMKLVIEILNILVLERLSIVSHYCLWNDIAKNDIVKDKR
jgi:hypothetical protein